MAKEGKENPKMFYSYINDGKKGQNKIGPLQNRNGKLVTETGQKTEVLNEYFASVFSDTAAGDPPDKESLTNEELKDIEFDEEKIIEKIDELKDFSSPGPDRVAAIVLKKLKKEVAIPLKLLFRSSIDEGKIPSDW